LDGVTLAPGAIDGEGIQVGRQFAEITAISAYSFTVSCALLLIMKYIPGLHLRISDDAEEHGLDLDQFFEEEIGDWGLIHDSERTRFSQAIVGHAPAHASSSSEVDPHNKASATSEITSDKSQ
jgi:Amt family ammonium transporter